MVRSRVVDQVGRVVGGRYRLIAPVGTGASADVFVADDVTLRRRVAVKVLHDALAGDEGFLRRFRAEAQAVASLRHPNIMTVFDWGEEADGPFLVLEYLGGGSVRDLLDRGHRLTPSQAVLVGLGAARGLDHAHRRGLVHRDVKPANLLFDDEGRLAIADFGIARALAEATWTEPAGAVVGTVRYASPEQVRGASIDGRADVYALALVLVEAVTGHVPFAADTTIATLMARLERGIPAPPEMGALAGVIEAAGTLDLAARLDAAGLVRALDAAARDLPAPAPLPLEPIEHLAMVEHRGDALTAGYGGASDAVSAIASTATITAVGAAAERAATGSILDPPTRRSAVLGPAGAGVGPENAGGPHATGPPAPVVPSGGARSRPGARGEGAPFGGETDAGGGVATPAGGRRRRRSRPEVANAAGDGRPLRRASRRRLPWLAAAAVLIVAGVTAGIVAPPILRPTYVLDDLRGHPVSDLIARPPAHFRVVTHSLRRTGAAVGVVLAQQPGPGRHRPGPVAVDVSVGPSLVTVPTIGALALADGRARLVAAGLVAGQAIEAYSDRVPAGNIADWSPKTQAEEGSTISLAVSKGPRVVPMPDVVTPPQPVSQASAALSAAGIAADHITQTQDYSDTVPQGDVISTSPAAGASADREGTVTLDISKGVQTVTVPDVVGRRVSDAQSRLVAAGLTVGSVFGPGGADTVVGQKPLAGATVKHGTAVLLAVF